MLTSCAQVELPVRKTADEDIPQIPPTLSAFEIKSRANMAENQALLDQIAPPMDNPRQVTKEKRKRPAIPSTPPVSGYESFRSTLLCCRHQ